jgi:hypothetical protein
MDRKFYAFDAWGLCITSFRAHDLADAKCRLRRWGIRYRYVIEE